MAQEIGGDFGELPPQLQQLFNTVTPKTATIGIQRGDLISFNYGSWQNDPYPLVIIADVQPGVKVRGLNLHYLTFPYIRNLLQLACVNRGFSYSNFKNDSYITSAFRSYKWLNIRTIKKLDCQFLLNVMAVARSFDPARVESIREVVREQLQRATNQGAEELSGGTPLEGGEASEV